MTSGLHYYLRRAPAAIVISAVGLYYLWAVRATGDRFDWRYDLGGYYDLLGRAFAHGRLYLPIDPRQSTQDMVLYGGRYYLYFGAAPAVLLFTPWRLLTGHDLPQNFALFLLCYGGFLFSCGALVRVLRIAGAKPPPWFVALLFLALGTCTSVPFLLLRPEVYEIAIGCGYFCLCAAIFFLTRSHFVSSGLMFGLAVASRPHLVLAGLVAIIFMRRDRRLSFVIPFLVAGLAIGAYNYARFGNPLEFGFRYQLAGPGQNRVELAARNVTPGLYFMLLSRPVFSPVFPWMRAVFRYPFDSPERHPFPPEYFIEPTAGALWLAPFLIAAFWIPRRMDADARRMLWIAALSSLLILCFLISTHLAAQRYEVDFLGLAVFAAIAALGLRARAVIVPLIAYGVVANLALGIQGPYDDLLKTRPASYVRIARWFSPIRKFRPAIDPPIAVEFEAAFASQSSTRHDPLIAIGHSHFYYALYADHPPGKLRFVSQLESGSETWEMADPGAAPVRVHLDFAPRAHRLALAVQGREIIAHSVPLLVTAPAEVLIGENPADPDPRSRRFSGHIRVVAAL